LELAWCIRKIICIYYYFYVFVYLFVIYQRHICRVVQAENERVAHEAQVRQLHIQLQAAKDQLASERAASAGAQEAGSKQRDQESDLQEKLQVAEQQNQEQLAAIGLLRFVPCRVPAIDVHSQAILLGGCGVR
jgi:flagellar biosynthesis/type III secretory pathway M-ring protein FliF/YscJ